MDAAPTPPAAPRASSLHVGLLVLIVAGSLVRTAPPTGVACGDGGVDVVVDDLDTPLTFCCTAHPTIPPPVLSTVAGCHGNAMAVDYDLRNVAPPGDSNAGQSWVVTVRDFAPAKNLSGYTHLRLALRGSNLNSHETLEVKLKNPGGLFTANLRSMTDLPVWRPLYLDFREFTGTGTIDLTNVTGLEIGITRCDLCEVFDNPSLGGPPDEHVGTLYVDEIAAVDLKPGAPHRSIVTGFETVAPNPAARAAAAQALLARVAGGGPGQALTPAWFPETNPNFNSYAQAEALLVFVAEYAITGDLRFRNAARRLADKLIALQNLIPANAAHVGAWFSAYTIEGDDLRPPGRASAPVVCDGSEVLLHDIDTCTWIGNVGWVLIALAKLQRAGFYENPPALAESMARGAAWIARQFGRHAGHPDLVSLGTEGNTSAYFGLLAAGQSAAAARLGSALAQAAWDPTQQRVKTGVGPADASSAIDVAGSWGVTLLRALGRRPDALASQGYAASIFGVTSFDGALVGYGDIAGPYTPTVEFGAQAAAAGIRDAALVMQNIASLQVPPGQMFAGAFPGAKDHWYGGPLTPWVTTMTGVSPTAWAYFAWTSDPLLDFLAPGPLTVTSTGHALTFLWLAPRAGVVTGYTIEAGSAPGLSNLAVLPLGPATSFTATAPSGTYFVRVRATDGTDSRVSNEIEFTAGAPPDRPRDMSVVANGHVVSLSWSPAGRGGPPSGFLLQAGTAPGSSNIIVLPVSGTSFVATGVPAGTYFVRASATNASGQGLASNEVSFSIGNAPQPGTPGMPAAMVAGSAVTLTWPPPASGSAPSSYTIIAGSAEGLNDVGTFPVGLTTTFSATSVPAGRYYVRVVATNAAGSGPASADAVVVVP